MSTSIVPSAESSRPSWVLLHAYAQIGKNLNHTTAHGRTKNNQKIIVSLSRERPPLPSNLYVDCPDGILRHPPRLLTMVDDLILFHIYVGSVFIFPRFHMSDFFIYRADPKRPSLKLLPHPRGRFYRIHQVGIVPRGDDGYTIAALVPDERHTPNSFLLHLLDSGSEDWISRALDLESPQMDFPVDIPMELDDLMYHTSSSVITFGSTIGWVDLYGGIIFCDMLGDKHTLRGVPVPLPLKQIQARDPSHRVLTNARYTRAISYINGRLRLVALEFDIIQLGGHDKETGWPSSRMDSWTITTWSNNDYSTGNSFDDWQKDCTLRGSDIAVGDYKSELPLSLPEDSHDEAGVKHRGLQNLFVSDPIFGMNASEGDGDIVYLTARVKFLHPKSCVLAIDMKNRRVHSVVKPGPRLPGAPTVDATYCTCSISNVPINTPAGETSNVE